MKKKINYTRVYCETCNDYHYKYWLDGSKEIIDEEDVDELLSTGMYYMERKVDRKYSFKGDMKRMFKALKMMLLYAFLCFIMPFVKLYEMCAEYKKFYR